MIQGMKISPHEISLNLWRGVFSFIQWLANVIFLVVEFILFLRLILFYLQANSGALVVHWLYRLSDMLTYPYRNIFGIYVWLDRPVDLTTIASIIGYAILGVVIFAILGALAPREKIIQPPFQQYH